MESLDFISSILNYLSCRFGKEHLKKLYNGITFSMDYIIVILSHFICYTFLKHVFYILRLLKRTAASPEYQDCMTEGYQEL